MNIAMYLTKSIFLKYTIKKTGAKAPVIPTRAISGSLIITINPKGPANSEKIKISKLLLPSTGNEKKLALIKSAAKSTTIYPISKCFIYIANLILLC